MAKILEVDEIKAMTDEQLAVELDRLRRHLYDLRCQAVTEKLEDTSALGRSRKAIARIQTILRQRQLAGAKAQPAAGQ